MFIGSGFIDLNLKIIELKYFDQVEAHLPVTFIFLGAAFSGLILFLIFGASSKKSKIERKDIPIRMISYGGSNYNLSFLVKTTDKIAVLNILNEGLFSELALEKA